MVKEILKEGNEILYKVSSQLQKTDDLSIVQDLIDTAEAHKETAVGLSAPQIGVNKRVLVWRDENGNWNTMINPIILQKKEIRQCKESCLSVNGDYLVSRYRVIEVIYFDKNFKSKKAKFFNFPAEIIQHEIDHLNGKLITEGEKIENE